MSGSAQIVSQIVSTVRTVIKDEKLERCDLKEDIDAIFIRGMADCPMKWLLRVCQC